MPSSQPEVASAATARERRLFLVALGAINLIFLAIDVAVGGPDPRAVVVGRLGLTTILFWMPAWLGRPVSRGEARQVLVLGSIAGTAAFGLLAWGAGGSAGAYLGFMPLLPLVITIAIPDEPLVPLGSGATAAAAGLAMIVGEGASLAHLALWIMAFASSTLYGWAGSVLWRRMRQRERDADERRVRAVEELAEAQRQRAQAERLATLGRLATSVAHGINGPLSFMGTNLRFVAERLASRPQAADDAELRSAIAETLEGIDRIGRLVVALNGFTETSEREANPCLLSDALEEALRLASVRLHDLALVECQVERDLPRLQTSRARLVEVFLTLLMNAADALEEQARQHPRPGTMPRITIAARRDGARIRVEVADTGPAIPPDVAPHLFEPFPEVRGQRGTGFGLALCREHVLRLGGWIEGGNAAGGGVRFLLWLPAANG